jgi:hypothetical protein
MTKTTDTIATIRCNIPVCGGYFLLAQQVLQGHVLLAHVCVQEQCYKECYKQKCLRQNWMEVDNEMKLLDMIL